MKTINLLLGLLIISLGLPLQAQRGYSSASVTSQTNRQQNHIPQAKAIVIEEYMNFRTHDIPAPKGKYPVALDLRWGASTIKNSQEEAVLQIGIATEKTEDFRKMPPLNLSIIIDKSGSMQGNRKIEKVKEALLVFIERLRPNDIVSVVMFDNEAQVVIPAQAVKDLRMLETSIERLEAGGGTNVEAGIVLAYQELLEHYDPKRTNRALLLTDGLANVGEINPEAISSQPAQQNLVKNINLSAIGVGVEYNSGLLRQLVKSAGGQLHFVSDDADIKKIFQEEVESLLFPIATKVELEIIYNKQLDIRQFFGYQPRFVANKIIVPLENFNAGLTQICLTSFAINKTANSGRIPVEVRLRYYDLQKAKQVEQKEQIKLNYQPQTQTSLLTASNRKAQEYILTYEQAQKKQIGSRLTDPEVKKNYLITYLAQSLKDVAKAYHAFGAEQALAICNFSLEALQEQALLQDEAVKIPFDVLKKYQKILQSK